MNIIRKLGLWKQCRVPVGLGSDSGNFQGVPAALKCVSGGLREL